MIVDTTFNEVINFNNLTELYTEYRQRVSELDAQDSERNRTTSDDHVCTMLSKLILNCTSKEDPVTGEKIHYIPVEYDFSKNTPGLGRYYAKNGVSLTYCRKDIREKLAGDYYYDIDIVNCHPTILIHYAQQAGMECKHLRDYIVNREQWLKKTNLSRDLAKELFLRLIFTGKIKNFCIDHGIPRDTIPQEIYDFEKELNTLSKNLLLCDDLRFFYNIIERSGKVNVHASALSFFLQDTERRILEIMTRYIKKKNSNAYKELSLQYDGFMIPKKYYSDKLLPMLENAVYKELGLSIKLSLKDNSKPKSILHRIVDNIVASTSKFMKKDSAQYIIVAGVSALITWGITSWFS